jgi:hypothetical protein
MAIQEQFNVTYSLHRVAAMLAVETDWKFSGMAKPTALYIPVEWLEPSVKILNFQFCELG